MALFDDTTPANPGKKLHKYTTLLLLSSTVEPIPYPLSTVAPLISIVTQIMTIFFFDYF